MNSESFRASAACGCMGAKLTCLYLCRYNEKELYAVVADVASYPKFIPFCTGSRIDPLALGRAMQGKIVVDAELTVGFLSFKESYVSSVTCIPFKSVQVRSCVLQPRPYRLDHWDLAGRCIVVHTTVQDFIDYLELPECCFKFPNDTPGSKQFQWANTRFI